ncbi:YceK/YidQ family lipoprotein [Pseudomonas orientalis]|uniref:YceK/YidQ family lipoprotein n=1 Tax=Pseudomonas orientalis TaxID=76758 RepID=UPI001FAFCF43|nr:YceK/YidQ family lipoprotein [Pseudomonas orientalis]UOB24548.1 YceK/YidQ family lipoprotein [Pseudomonas orientalis]
MRIKNMKLLTVVWMASLMLGCGTVTTVMREDAVTVRALKADKTYCQSVPRIYSGVTYNLCVLHAPPNTGGGLAVNSVPLTFIDVPLSGVLDTLLLPYTVYRQSADGSIDLR